MDGLHLVAVAMAAVEAWDMPAVAQCLADDFKYMGSGKAMTKQEFVMVQSAICVGLPDFTFNTAKLWQNEDKIWATVQITGTHLNDIDLSILGMPIIPATGIYCQLPVEQIEYTVVDDRITKIVAPHGHGGGIPGILAQLGVELPYPK